MVHVLPHWNWEGRDGHAIPVFVYTNAPEAELFLNGRSLGRKRRGVDRVEIPVGPNVRQARTFSSRYRLQWSIPWQPGVLRVDARDGDRVVATHERRTAGPPARIALAADRSELQADDTDLSFITVRIEDREGNLCPVAENLVQFAVEGPGAIAASDNGDPATLESFQADGRRAFNGLALLVVRAQQGGGGRIRVDATSAGLTPAPLTLTSYPRRLQ